MSLPTKTCDEELEDWDAETLGDAVDVAAVVLLAVDGSSEELVVWPAAGEVVCTVAEVTIAGVAVQGDTRQLQNVDNLTSPTPRQLVDIRLPSGRPAAPLYTACV